MLRDKYEIDNFFMNIQTLTSEMDPELAAIDRLLDDDALYQMVRRDLEQRYGLTKQTGRPSTPVEVILRMLMVRHLYNLSYEATEQYVKDSLVLRRFCRVYFEKVPDDTVLIRWANTIQPETLQALNERVVALAVEQRVTRGRKLRTDGTVVETNIHYPTDSSLLADSVRVLSRTLKRAQAIVEDTAELGKQVFRDRTRSAKRAARAIGRAARQSSQATQQTYRKLVDITRASVKQARQVLDALHEQGSAQAAGLIEKLETFIPRAEQVINQTVRRVFDGEQVPASDKIVSIFEPHTAIIKRGKAHKDAEFGRKVWLDEVEGGIITRFEVLAGNPPDDQQWPPAIDQHIRQFGRPPTQASADRGLWSPENEAYATKQGVKRVILPQTGTKSAARQQHEQQRWFRLGRRWHAGVEGRISVIKRKYGLDRCREHGEDGFHRWVGWGVIANNLTMISRAQAPS